MNKNMKLSHSPKVCETGLRDEQWYCVWNFSNRLLHPSGWQCWRYVLVQGFVGCAQLGDCLPFYRRPCDIKPYLSLKLTFRKIERYLKSQAASRLCAIHHIKYAHGFIILFVEVVLLWLCRYWWIQKIYLPLLWPILGLKAIIYLCVSCVLCIGALQISGLFSQKYVSRASNHIPQYLCETITWPKIVFHVRRFSYRVRWVVLCGMISPDMKYCFGVIYSIRLLIHIKWILYNAITELFGLKADGIYRQ